MFTNSFWDDLNSFRRTFDQAFENFYRNSTNRGSAGADSSEWTFAPAVETGWNDEYLNMRVVLPGVKEQDLKLSVQGNQLFLSGERRAPENFGKEGQTYQLMSYGKFERVIQLPNGLDVEKLQAHLRDGVLDIRIPVAQAMKPREIQISTGEKQKTLAA